MALATPQATLAFESLLTSLECIMGNIVTEATKLIVVSVKIKTSRRQAEATEASGPDQVHCLKYSLPFGSIP